MIIIDLKNKIKKTLRTKIVRNLLIVITGTAGAQAITMISTPIITRIYSPDAIGLLGLFMACIAILAPITSLTYPIAILLPKEDHEAKGLVQLSVYIAISISSTYAVIILFFGDSLLRIINSESIVDYVFLIPLATFSVSALQITKQWLIRKKKFSITAKVAVYQALFVNSIKIFFGLINPLVQILIGTAVVGSFTHITMLLLGIKKSDLKNKKENNTSLHKLTYINNIAKKYKDFPLYRAPQVFINGLTHSLPIFVLASFFGPSAAGFYTIARAILELPSNLIGQSVADIFNVRVNEAAHNCENLNILLIKGILVFAALGAIPFITVIFYGPWLFEFVLGNNWAMAGEYASWLAYILYFQLLNRPAVLIIPILNMQKGLLNHEIFSTIGKILSIYFGTLIFQDDITAVALYSLFGSLSYIILIFWVYYECKSNKSNKNN